MVRIRGLESDKTRLDGVIGRSITDMAKVQNSISELKAEIQQLYQKFQEEVAAALLDVRLKIADAREHLSITQDMLIRANIVAPISGTVQSLKVFSVGQVVRPGETLLEIVPDSEQLVIYAQFSPTDIDSIRVGQNTEIRFPAFHSRETPMMTGRLESISRDRILDEQSRQFYYLGMISLSRADLPERYRRRIIPGMPAEVIVAAGERTVLAYLTSPLFGSLHKAFREP
jgi:HlyD family secretion protein